MALSFLRAISTAKVCVNSTVNYRAKCIANSNFVL